MLSYTVFRLQEHGPSKSFHAGHRGLLAQMVVTFNCERNSIEEALPVDGQDQAFHLRLRVTYVVLFSEGKAICGQPF